MDDMQDYGHPLGRNHLAEVIGSGPDAVFRKYFVHKLKNVSAYGSSIVENPDEFDYTEPWPEAMQSELAGLEAMSQHYPVLLVRGKDEAKASVDYEFLSPDDYTRADLMMKTAVQDGKKEYEGRLLQEMKNHGKHLREHHDSQPDGYKVNDLVDKHLGNIMINHDQGYKLIDYESFDLMSKVGSLVSLPMSMYTAAASVQSEQENDLNDEFMMETDKYIRAFFEGYFEKGGAPWLDEQLGSEAYMHDLSSEAYRHLTLNLVKVNPMNQMGVVRGVDEILRESIR